MDFEAGHQVDQVYADSQLDDKWKDGDRDDDLITLAFNRSPGLCVPVPDNADVLAIFESFFTVKLLAILVTETNRFFLDEKFDTLGLFSQFMQTFSE